MRAGDGDFLRLGRLLRGGLTRRQQSHTDRGKRDTGQRAGSDAGCLPCFTQKMRHRDSPQETVKAKTRPRNWAIARAASSLDYSVRCTVRSSPSAHILDDSNSRINEFATEPDAGARPIFAHCGIFALVHLAMRQTRPTRRCCVRASTLF